MQCCLNLQSEIKFSMRWLRVEKNLKVWHNATLVKLERENDAWIAQIQMKDNTIKKVLLKY